MNVQTHKSQRFSGELGFNYEPDEHHSFGLRYMPETGIGNADRNSSVEPSPDVTMKKPTG